MLRKASDNLPEDVQKFISETSEIYGQCICKACEVSARRNMKKRNSGEKDRLTSMN